MEDQYRRLRYDPTVVGNPFWSQQPKASANSRLKRHAAGARKKSKENGSKAEIFNVPNYLKAYRDKYGSVSAHSTSAIYGALRAPHCHAMYTPDMWYASVRSLNSRPRDTVYPAEAYDWRDAAYDLSREGCSTAPHELSRHPPCVCMISRKPLSSSRPPLRCKHCASLPQAALKVPLSVKKVLMSDKAKLNSVSEEKDDVKTEPVDRMSVYKKHVKRATNSKISRYSKEPVSKETVVTTRKSILECDVSAYDLIKKIPKSQISEDSDDVEDDISEKDVVNAKSRIKKHQSKSRPVSSKIQNLAHRNHKNLTASKSISPRIDNSIYNESSSVLLGGQRIFTQYQSSKASEMFDLPNTGIFNSSVNGENPPSRWREMYTTEETVCIPEPDYDESDDDVLSFTIKDLKLTYSPPILRKSSSDDIVGLGASKEISKSMSSLLSQETMVPNISINHSYTSSPSIRTNDETFDVPGESSSPLEIHQSESGQGCIMQDPQRECSLEISFDATNEAKYETFSSSDCSSNGGTISSDYPTWTSSSSSELKSILKKKRRRENIIFEKEDAAKVFSDSDSKDSQRKKQVQFRANADHNVFAELLDNSNQQDSIIQECGQQQNTDVCQKLSSVICSSENASHENAESVINCNENMYETLGKSNERKRSPLPNGDRFKKFHSEEFRLQEASNTSGKSSPSAGEHETSSFVDVSNVSNEFNVVDHQLSDDTSGNVSVKLPGRSSSLEDIRETERHTRRIKKISCFPSDEDKKSDSRRKRRTTLPKRRFSDLHLHILLCPTKSSLCGDGSSSDDVPLTTSQYSSPRAHRSLPESPIELQDSERSFCFDDLDRSPKEKGFPSSRSRFYVSVDSPSQLDGVQSSNDVATPLSIDSVVPQSCTGSNTLQDVDSSAPQSASDDDQLDIDEATSPLHDDTDEDNLENEYENLDPIYEELSDISNSSKRLISLESPQKSFFEGASKTDILSYLEDAKERGLSEGLSEDESKTIPEEDEEDENKLVIAGEGEKTEIAINGPLKEPEVLLIQEEVAAKVLDDVLKECSPDDSSSNKVSRSNSAEVERNDSGVGAETSKPSRISKQAITDNEEQLCADCDHQVEPVEDEISGILYNPLVCRKCDLRRCERKEIIIEFVDTELKYGRDLRIIKEEFYRPMEIAGLLAKEQLLTVFLNFEELIVFNIKFSEKLQDALDIAMEQGDEDYTTVNIGKIFLETSSMLHAFETYCVKQAPASVLLSNLEKEKELLRIFLRVSQMENTLLRRMNLPAFLMVPVQRVTRYPLLLSRLHKVTPIHHKDRNALKEAQQKVELHLEHINQQTKGIGGTKIWRRISNISASHRRLGNLQDIGSIKLRKMALEILKWKQDEVRFVMAGKLHFTQITDYPWNKKGRSVKFTQLHALLVALGKPNSNYRPEIASNENPVLFPRNTGIRDASLVLMKEKNGRFVIVRDPLYLGSCVISCDSDSDEVFEIQEYTTKEAYLLKGENKKDTKEWLRQLRYHAKDLGTWRRRRNALANIMINGMIRP